MSQHQIVLLLTLTLTLTLTHALPADVSRHVDNEDVREQLMHPKMPTAKLANTAESTNAYWLTAGERHVAEKLSNADEPLRGIAKNIIFFIGDGMSLSTLAATRNLLGGEEQRLAFESFPSTGLAKTYSLDRLVPDSASTATALLCGVKTNDGILGLNGHVQRGECQTPLEAARHQTTSIASWALDAGKSAGLVTTTRVTHASPAAVYAHTSDRDWENDQRVKQTCRGAAVDDIALQLMQGDVGQRLSVIMGGGKAQFVDGAQYSGGLRGDGRDLIEEFVQQNAQNRYVETREQLLSLNLTQTQRLLALFNDDHLLFNEQAQAASDRHQPTLAEMTRKAIELLSAQNERGYFLFVEGGLIDMAHHDTRARRALDEMLELSKAVQVARDMTNLEDTLIVVSADHAHTMSLAGYASRGSDIFDASSATALDEQPYLTLSYANGPFYNKFFAKKTHERLDPRTVSESENVFPATVPMASETHGGEDVGVFASGPWAHLFSGVNEQSTLPHMMAFAACIGDGLQACELR